jgi:hypothetical protein
MEVNWSVIGIVMLEGVISLEVMKIVAHFAEEMRQRSCARNTPTQAMWWALI